MKRRELRLRARCGVVRCPLRPAPVDIERCQACPWAEAVAREGGEVTVVCAARPPVLLPLPD